MRWAVGACFAEIEGVWAVCVLRCWWREHQQRLRKKCTPIVSLKNPSWFRTSYALPALNWSEVLVWNELEGSSGKIWVPAQPLIDACRWLQFCALGNSTFWHCGNVLCFWSICSAACRLRTVAVELKANGIGCLCQSCSEVAGLFGLMVWSV